MAADANNATQVTISLLPVSLSLVHIPRSRLAQLSHPILRQILQPNPTFLNITCNEIELSIFAEHHMLVDFEPIARRDRHKQRSRSGSGSSRKRGSDCATEPVEVSCERWNVLQIDSHSDQLDNSGARVHELSAPLAGAGISILYQSSYMSDFIFVKESRLQEVMNLLGSAGFDLYSSDPDLLTSRVVSPILSPILMDDSSVADIGHDFTTESGAVLTRTRSSIDASVSAAAIAFHNLAVHRNTQGESPELSPIPPRLPSRAKSHSPTAGEVVVLSPNLACVGLSDDNIDTWSLKIVKLVAFPELIPAKRSSRPSKKSSSSDDSRGHPSGFIAIPHPINTSSPFSSPRRGHHRRDSSSDSLSSSSEEEGYFSHSPRGNLSAASLLSYRSYPDLVKSAPVSSPSFKPTAKHLTAPVAPLSPLSPLDPLAPRHPGLGHSEKTGGSSSAIKKQIYGNNHYDVPFFSFTRTSEGSSLTTDVSMLAMLFPPNERYMVKCSGELDILDAQNSDAESESEDDAEDASLQGGTLKCLQIDLRRFGLDKHGLVNSYSQVLEKNGINHMYSSTYKTANLLVSKAHASRARALLRAC
ncbi:hypothetical protein BJ138DRAFT_996108 [Hygrophoropsis aurantiaca]|uniref:Uncharacterized protein n=1 Tax=Hygrophoropsis aurantiaca TaxID=72124 RepID=A0ACB8ARX8_9AGAM|nr:hypothetical protein BJ138DRAFT_996108 [Hygrophoropsis aurantiaca]